MSEEVHGCDDVDDDTLRSVVDVERFARLAGNDTAGLVRMMAEYLDETREIAGTWPRLFQEGKQREVSEQLHRCKGGAAIFGFSRILSLIGGLEKNPALAASAFDARAFERELALVELAITALAGGRLL